MFKRFVRLLKALCTTSSSNSSEGRKPTRPRTEQELDQAFEEAFARCHDAIVQRRAQDSTAYRILQASEKRLQKIEHTIAHVESRAEDSPYRRRRNFAEAARHRHRRLQVLRNEAAAIRRALRELQQDYETTLTRAAVEIDDENRKRQERLQECRDNARALRERMEMQRLTSQWPFVSEPPPLPIRTVLTILVTGFLIILAYACLLAWVMKR